MSENQSTSIKICESSKINIYGFSLKELEGILANGFSCEEYGRDMERKSALDFEQNLAKNDEQNLAQPSTKQNPTQTPPQKSPQNLAQNLAQKFPPYRAKQIYNWLYVRYENDFAKMMNLPKDLRGILSRGFVTQNLKLITKETSKDGTQKYLFEASDGHCFESVCIKMRDKMRDEKGRILASEKWTFCLSSQIGCKVGCSFCSTARGGFVRNLSAGEIVEQVVFLKRDNALESHKRVNIVFMGMGEPLHNFDEVVKAIKILSELDGLAISPKRQTISTSGIAPQIENLGNLHLGVQLAISLHAVDDELRSRLMPINKTYNIEAVIEAVRRFPIDTRKRVMFEYLVIKDINDDLGSAKKLLKLLNGIKSKVNLILFNPHKESKYQRPEMKKVKEFADFLVSKGLLATIRESKGVDISAACGQLREKKLHNAKQNNDGHKINDLHKNVSYETFVNDLDSSLDKKYIDNANIKAFAKTTMLRPKSNHSRICKAKFISKSIQKENQNG